MDAAITAAATLGVVEPAMTGIGGDCFMLMSVGGTDRILAYNGAGRAAGAADPGWFQQHGMRTIDADSIHAVTVPGCVEAWCRLAQDHGKLGIDRLLQPAIRYAEEGFPVAPRVAFDWAASAPRLARYPAAAKQYLPGGKPPAVGDRMQLPLLGKALREIAWKGTAGFYQGWVAEDIVRCLKAEGSLMRIEDLISHRGEYSLPIKTSYRGLQLWECPPPGQGLTALIMLNILAQFRSVGPARFRPIGCISRSRPRSWLTPSAIGISPIRITPPSRSRRCFRSSMRASSPRKSIPRAPRTANACRSSPRIRTRSISPSSIATAMR